MWWPLIESVWSGFNNLGKVFSILLAITLVRILMFRSEMGLRLSRIVLHLGFWDKRDYSSSLAYRKHTSCDWLADHDKCQAKRIGRIQLADHQHLRLCYCWSPWEHLYILLCSPILQKISSLVHLVWLHFLHWEGLNFWNFWELYLWSSIMTHKSFSFKISNDLLCKNFPWLCVLKLF